MATLPDGQTIVQVGETKEWDNMSGWTTQIAGDSTLVSSPTNNGSGALRVSTDNTNEAVITQNKSASNAPTEGQVRSYWKADASSVDIAAVFRYQNDNNYLVVSWNGGNEVQLNEMSGGSGTTLDETTAFGDDSPMSWERITIRLWEDGGTVHAEVKRADGSVVGRRLSSGSVSVTNGGAIGVASSYFSSSRGNNGNLFTDTTEVFYEKTPSAPSNLSVTPVSQSRIDGSFTDESNIEGGFRVYRASSAGGSFSQIDTLDPNETTFSDTGLDVAEDYYYKVTAFNIVGESDFSNEDGATTLGPAPPSLAASPTNTNSVEYDITDESTSEEEFRIYRSTSPGVTTGDTLAATESSSTEGGTGTSYQGMDESLSYGTTYYYAATAYDSDSGRESPLSNEVSVTTAPEAPSGLTVTGHDADSINVSATDNASTEDGFRWYQSTDGGSSWTEAGTTEANETTFTYSGLRNGEEYTLRVVAFAGGAESSDSNHITQQTDLPDEDAPVLGNGIEDEVAVDRESATTNYGDVRIQIRETGENTWDSNATGFSEFIGSYDTLTMEFVGREDGERYEVRARTETEHVTGVWTDIVAITAQFPAVTNLTATAISETEAELTWDDNADNEAGQLVVRERLVDGEWWPERIIEDVGPNTETFVDDTLPPDTEVRYRIRAFTPYTEADSNTDTATTADIGLSRRRIPASGWYAEVETPNGDLLRPTILTESQPQPQLNDTPEVELALPSNDRWIDPELDRATLRVWCDGERLPISRVEIPGNSSSQSTLIGRGGIALDEVVARDVDDLVPTHEFVDQLLTELDIPHVVDDPASDTRADVGVLSAPSTLSLVDTFQEVDDTSGNDIPIEADVDAGALVLQQAAWATPARFADSSSAPIDDLDPASGTYWEDRPLALESSGDSISWTFSSTYQWPADRAEAKIRLHAPQEEHPAFVVRLDGQIIADFPADNGLQAESNPYWETFFAQDPSFDGVTISGNTTVEVEATSDSQGKVIVDGGGLLDSAYDGGISFEGTSIDQDGQIVGLNLHPKTLDLTTDDVGTIEQVVGASLDVELDNTEDAQALAVSNDGGTTWQSASNTDSLDATFDSGSTQLRARVTLSRYDDGGQFSVGQSISNLSLAADLDDTPFIEAEAFEDSVAGLLTKLANRQRFAWEVQSPDQHPGLDAGGDDPGVVVFTQLGQREASTNAPILDYEVRRDSSTVVDTVIAYGPSRRVEDERVVLTGLGYVGIGDDYLQPGTVRVYQPGTDGEPDTVYDPDEDYRLLRNDGSIARREGSAIADGEEVHIDYETRRRVEYTLPGADGTGDTIRETFSNAVTQRALQQAALFTAKRLSSPQREATIELARDNLGYQLVDALSVADVPGLNEPRRIAGVDVRTDRVSVDLGDQQSAGEVVDAINRRLSGLAERL